MVAKKMRNSFLVIILLFSFIDLKADTLDFNTYLQNVIENNPISDQATLEQEKNIAKYLKSKGYFDPKLKIDNDNKFFDGKNYYNITKAGLEIPSWFGLSFFGDYSYTNGTYLNPENFLPDDGLFNAGLEVNLGKGLIIDERRMMLYQGRNFREMATWKKFKVLNELILNAKVIYHNWNYNYEFTKLIEEGIGLANVKHDGTKEKFFSGDTPAIDTVETFIQLQKRQSELLESQNLLRKSAVDIANITWIDGVENSSPPTYLNGDSFKDIVDENLLATEDINNPNINLIGLDIQNKEIERDFKRENLKPELALQYNVLNDPMSPDPFISDIPVNYKWNLNFSLPIFLRKERGDLNVTKAELNSMNLELDVQKRNLENKIRQLRISLDILAEQIKVNEEVVSNFNELLKAEIIKFNAGESSVLIVNIRENYYLDSKLKLLDLKKKYLINFAELEYYIGNSALAFE